MNKRIVTKALEDLFTGTLCQNHFLKSCGYHTMMKKMLFVIINNKYFNYFQTANLTMDFDSKLKGNNLMTDFVKESRLTLMQRKV